MHIPSFDPLPELAEVRPDIVIAIERVVDSGRFVLGQEVEAFEAEVCEYLGVKHAVGVASGTDALVIGLLALGIEPGDEVITSTFTFVATVEAIVRVGAVPVLVDIDPRTFNVDPWCGQQAITPRTKAIIPVHLFGQSADMEPIMDLADRHGLKVLEDVAQAFGGAIHERKLGSIGHAGAFSFFPTKNLACCGDGGMLTTNSRKVAETARVLRAHGCKRPHCCEVHGLNSRLDAMQAAILRVKLRHVDEWNRSRRKAASIYDKLLMGFEQLARPFRDPSAEHVFNQYTARVQRGLRDSVRCSLETMNVSTGVYYALPVHKQPAYEHLRLDLPESEMAAAEVMSLPLWPKIDRGTQNRVAQALRTALEDVR